MKRLSLIETLAAVTIVSASLGLGAITMFRLAELEAKLVERLSGNARLEAILERLSEDLEQAGRLEVTRTEHLLIDLGGASPDSKVVDRPGLSKLSLRVRGETIEWRCVDIWPADFDSHLARLRDDPKQAPPGQSNLDERIPAPARPDTNPAPGPELEPGRLLERRELGQAGEPPGGWSLIWNGARGSHGGPTSNARFPAEHELWRAESGRPAAPGPSLLRARATGRNESVEVLDLRILARDASGRLRALPHSFEQGFHGDGQARSAVRGERAVPGVLLTTDGDLEGLPGDHGLSPGDSLLLETSTPDKVTLARPFEGRLPARFRVLSTPATDRVTLALEGAIVESPVTVEVTIEARPELLWIELEARLGERDVILRRACRLGARKDRP